MSTGFLAGPARVLVVCTGNICRSPLAEALLRTRLAARDVGPDQVLVESAGVRAMVGEPMTTPAARELAGLGGDGAELRACQLEPDIVRRADLVLTAQRHHRASVAQLVPAAVRWTFTLRELRRLLDGADLTNLPTDPAERVRGLPLVAARRRGLGVTVRAADDDVQDPYGRNDVDYAATTAQIEPAIQALVDALVPAPH